MRDDANKTSALLKAVREREFVLSLIIGSILLGVYVFLSIPQEGSPPQTFTTIARNLALGLLPEAIIITFAFAFSYLVLRGIQEIREEHQIEQIAHRVADLQSSVEGISVFRINRSRLPDFRTVLESAAAQIDLLAVQHDHLVTNHLNVLMKKAEEGCEIRILMMSPHDASGASPNPIAQAFGSHWQVGDLQARLVNNHTRLRQWIETLPQHAANNVSAKLYSGPPIGVYTIVDRNRDSGYAQIELLAFHGMYSNDIPHYVVRKSIAPEFFMRHVNSFNSLWEHAERVT